LPDYVPLTKGQQLKIGNQLLNDLGEQRNSNNPALGREDVLLALEHGESLAELGLHAGTLESVGRIAEAPTIRVGEHLKSHRPALQGGMDEE
jgi:hypothetical protein